jgi:hypothetical protein
MDCGAEGHLGHMMVSLPLASEEISRYVCPMCYLGVAIPRRIESRFLQQLTAEQTDSFGNPSTFRSWLAQEIKQRPPNLRPYALVSLPSFEIPCPEDGTLLEAWSNYPDSPSLLCRRCGSRHVRAEFTGEIGCGAITTW